MTVVNPVTAMTTVTAVKKAYSAGKMKQEPFPKSDRDGFSKQGENPNQDRKFEQTMMRALQEKEKPEAEEVGVEEVDLAAERKRDETTRIFLMRSQISIEP